MKAAIFAAALLANSATAINIRGAEAPASEVAEVAPAEAAEAVTAAPAEMAPMDPSLNPLNVANPSNLALDKMLETNKLIDEGFGGAAALCVEEQEKTVAWQEEVQDMGNAARRASKEKLAAALEKRLAGLKVFLKRLKKMRSRLREHIQRVNDIYQTKYKENLDNVHVAATVLKQLGMIQSEPWNPHINPIKNFKSLEEAKEDGDAPGEAAVVADETSATGAAEPASAEAASGGEGAEPTSLLQLVESQYTSAGPQCKAATGAAFNVYELGLKLNSMMDVSFENEREVLKEFRETLGGMIAKREAKLAAMTAQLNKLKAALAAAGSPFAELKEGLADHLVHVKKACAEHAEQAVVVKSKVTAIMGLIKEHHLGISTDGAATGAAAPDAATGVAGTDAAALL